MKRPALPLPLPSRAAAFTLVELLAVIGIVAVLAALSLGPLAQAQATARRSVCAQNLGQIFIAFDSFAADNNNCWPARLGFDANGVAQGNFAYFLQPYLPSYNPYGQWYKGKGKVYVCPELYHRTHYSGGTSYGVNGHLYSSFPAPTLVAKARLSHPSRTILIGDSCWIGNGSTSWIDETRLPGRSFPDTSPHPPVHANGGGNIAFGDGHVEYWPDTSILTQSQYLNGGSADVWTMK